MNPSEMVEVIAISLGLVRGQMLFSHVGRGEDRDEGRRRSSFLDIWKAVGLLALDEAHDADDIESEIAGRIDGLDGRGARGADIVDDDDTCTFLAKAFDTLAGTVLLLGLADEEAMERAAYYRDANHNWVSAHSEAADGVGVPVLRPHFFQEDQAGEARSASVKRGGAAVDVIVAGATGRKFEFAEAK